MECKGHCLIRTRPQIMKIKLTGPPDAETEETVLSMHSQYKRIEMNRIES